MTTYLHKTFRKQFKKLSIQDQTLVKERIRLFVVDQFHPRLRNHSLKGKYQGCSSIDIRPDLRAVYYLDNNDFAVFTTVGSHSQLYK